MVQGTFIVSIDAGVEQRRVRRLCGPGSERACGALEGDRERRRRRIDGGRA